MKLLLKKNIPDLGTLGQIVEVRPGYARNYLVPQGLAIEVNNANLQWFEAQKRRLIAQEEETREKLRLTAKELEGTSCTIIARATEEGHLFGSVTPKVIADHLTSEGFSIDTKTIQLEAPIKELGIYSVTVRLHADVSTEIKVWVVKGDENHAQLDSDDTGGSAASESADSTPEDAASSA